MASKKIIILDIGFKCNDWTVVDIASSNKYHRRQYRVKCKCGFTRNHEATILNKKKATRCRNCGDKAAHQRMTDRSIKKQIGMNYNGWTVVEFAGYYNDNNGKNRILYTVQHICGFKRTPKDFYHIKRRLTCFPCKKLNPKSAMEYIKKTNPAKQP